MTSRSTIRPWVLIEMEELYFGYKIAFCAKTKEEIEVYLNTFRSSLFFDSELWIANVVENTLESVVIR